MNSALQSSRKVEVLESDVPRHNEPAVPTYITCLCPIKSQLAVLGTLYHHTLLSLSNIKQ